MDAIASIFVNYHEERRELVEKTEAADLIEQNVAELMQLCYRGASAGVGTEWKDDASAEDEGGRASTCRRAPRRPDGFGATSMVEASSQLLIQFVVLPRKMGTGRDSLEAPVRLRPHALPPLGVKDVFLFATEAGAPAWLTLGFEHVGSSASLIHLRFDLLFKRDRGVSRAPPAVPRRRASQLLDGPRSRSSATPRASTPWSAVQERVAEYGEKQVVRLAKEAANAAPRRGRERRRGPAAASTDVPERDLLAAPSPLRASSARRRRRRRAAGAGAAPPRRRVQKRVVDDADADDEDEAWEPGRPSMMDLDDDEQEQAAKAKRKLKRRSRRRAHPAARLHEAVTQEQERNAFLERIQAEEVRREQARIAAARPVPPPPNRATGAGDDSDEGWEESDEDDPVEDLIHRERIRERDLLRTPGCLALGRKAFRLEDMPRTAPGRAEVQIKELGFHFIDPLAPIAEKEIVRASALDDGHLIVELKYLQAMHVKNRMLKKCCYTLYLLELADRLRGEASRETLKTARKNVVEAEGEYQLALSNYRQMELWCFFKLDMALLARPTLAGVIRKFANAIARKAAEARGETFVPTPYDETAVDAVVVTAVPPVAPVVAPEPAPPSRHGRAPASATLVADGAKKVVFHYGKGSHNGSDYLVARWRASRDGPAGSSMCYRVIRDAKRRAGNEPPRAEDDQCPAYYGVDYRETSGKLTCQFTVHEGTKTSGRKSAPADRQRSREALRSLENAFSEFMPERFYGISDDHCPAGKFMARASIPGSGKGDARIVFGTYDSKVEVAPPRLERYKADFALQLKDLAYVEAADEAYLRDQAAALAPPEPMPDGSRPPIDAHSRRVARASRTHRRVDGRRRELLPRPVRPPRALRRPASRAAAKLYVVPNGEVVSPPPPPIYHVTENGERLLVLYATRPAAADPRDPAGAQAAEFLSLFDESEVEMAAAMFDARPIEIARPLLFESEEDAAPRRAGRAEAQAQVAQEEAQGRRRRRRRRRERATRRRRADGAASPRRAEAPAEALAEAPPTAPPVEAPAEAPPPAAAPAKKKKKKRSPPRRAARRDLRRRGGVVAAAEAVDHVVGELREGRRGGRGGRQVEAGRGDGVGVADDLVLEELDELRARAEVARERGRDERAERAGAPPRPAEGARAARRRAAARGPGAPRGGRDGRGRRRGRAAAGDGAPERAVGAAAGLAAPGDR
ncbi:hypothetical protein JL722_14232 [Aureococcus anophagefferens]|nr:hypothetical protein JL722_14232 [Aureococcus anophagefferens]